MSSGKEFILCAAIHFHTGYTVPHQPKNISRGVVVCGRRHHNCYATARAVGNIPRGIDNVQGFITSKDRFVDRVEAGKLALAAGQIATESLALGDELISEDLY